jgi:hypothetical protein
LEECGRWRYSHVPTSSGPFFSRLARLAIIFFIDSFFAARFKKSKTLKRIKNKNGKKKKKKKGTQVESAGECRDAALQA